MCNLLIRLRLNRFSSLSFLLYLKNNKNNIDYKLYTYLLNLSEQSHIFNTELSIFYKTFNFITKKLNNFNISNSIVSSNYYYFLDNNYFKNHRRGFPKLFLNSYIDNILNLKTKKKIESLSLKKSKNMFNFFYNGLTTSFNDIFIFDQVHLLNNIHKFRYYNFIENFSINQKYLLLDNFYSNNGISNNKQINKTISQLILLKNIIDKSNYSIFTIHDIFNNTYQNLDTITNKHP